VPDGGSSGAMKRFPLEVASACLGTSVLYHRELAARAIISSLGLTFTESLVEQSTVWTLLVSMTVTLALVSAWCIQDVGTIAAAAFTGPGASLQFHRARHAERITSEGTNTR
jgi:hypothetical protein